MSTPRTFGVRVLQSDEQRAVVDAVCRELDQPYAWPAGLSERQAVQRALAALDRTPPSLTDAVTADRRRAAREGNLRRGLARAILLLSVVLLLALWIVPVAAEGIGAGIEVGLAAERWAG